MNKRQVKKFTKAVAEKKSLEDYRAAAGRGSKKLYRRHKALGRFWSNGLKTWDTNRRFSMSLRRLERTPINKGNVKDIVTMLGEYVSEALDLL